MSSRTLPQLPVSTPPESSSSLMDTTAPFLALPWTASLLSQPNIVLRVPGSRKTKTLPDTEDSLFADTLKTPRTIRSCISFHTKPAPSDEKIEEISTLILAGDGMNGHHGICHGGIVASILDECMGILQSANHERDHQLSQRKKGLPEADLPSSGPGTFTVELKVTYLRPLIMPGAVLVKTRTVKRERRKEWIFAEVLQEVDGHMVVCSRGEALFVEPKLKAKL